MTKVHWVWGLVPAAALGTSWGRVGLRKGPSGQNPRRVTVPLQEDHSHFLAGMAWTPCWGKERAKQIHQALDGKAWAVEGLQGWEWESAESRESCSSTGRQVSHTFSLELTWLFLYCPPTIYWLKWKTIIHMCGPQIDNVCNHCNRVFWFFSIR